MRNTRDNHLAPQAISALLGLSLMSGVAIAQDALFIDEAGAVGIGTNAPAAPLDLRRADGTAQVRVTETSGNAANRDLFALVNNGGVLFTMENTATGNLWDFSNRAGGFVITRRGTGGQELTVLDDGTFYVGPGGAKNLEVLPNGNASLAGTLTESSSRESKRNINVVDGPALMAKLRELPIAEWQYKNADVRHIGPMAADFHAAFGLGPNSKSIAPKDLAGLALATIKEQQRQIDRHEERIRQLEEQLKDAHGRQQAVESLTRRIERLESSQALQVTSVRD